MRQLSDWLINPLRHFYGSHFEFHASDEMTIDLKSILNRHLNWYRFIRVFIQKGQIYTTKFYVKEFFSIKDFWVLGGGTEKDFSEGNHFSALCSTAEQGSGNFLADRAIKIQMHFRLSQIVVFQHRIYLTTQIF